MSEIPEAFRNAIRDALRGKFEPVVSPEGEPATLVDYNAIIEMMWERERLLIERVVKRGHVSYCPVVRWGGYNKECRCGYAEIVAPYAEAMDVTPGHSFT